MDESGRCTADGCLCVSFSPQFYRPALCLTCFHFVDKHFPGQWEHKVHESGRPCFVHVTTGERLWARPLYEVELADTVVKPERSGSERPTSSVPVSELSAAFAAMGHVEEPVVPPMGRRSSWKLPPGLAAPVMPQQQDTLAAPPAPTSEPAATLAPTSEPAEEPAALPEPEPAAALPEPEPAAPISPATPRPPHTPRPPTTPRPPPTPQSPSTMQPSPEATPEQAAPAPSGAPAPVADDEPPVTDPVDPLSVADIASAADSIVTAEGAALPPKDDAPPPPPPATASTPPAAAVPHLPPMPAAAAGSSGAAIAQAVPVEAPKEDAYRRMLLERFCSPLPPGNPFVVELETMLGDSALHRVFPIRQTLSEEYTAPRYIIVTPLTVMVVSAHPTRLGLGLLKWERSLESLTHIAVQAAPVSADGSTSNTSVLFSFDPETPDTLKFLRNTRMGIRARLKRGVLKKKKKGTWKTLSWKTRHFMLDKNVLVYYKSDKAVRPKGTIKLSGWVEVTPNDSKKHGFMLRTGGSHHHFRASSVEQAEEWISAIATNAMVLWAGTTDAQHFSAAAGTASDIVQAVQDARAALGITPVEGLAEAAVPTPAPATAPLLEVNWVYLDDWDQAQGPFPENLMRQWLTAGFLKSDTLVHAHIPDNPRFSGHSLFLPIARLWSPLSTAFTGTTAWQDVYNRAAQYQTMAQTAINLGGDPSTVMHFALLMQRRNLEPLLETLLELMMHAELSIDAEGQFAGSREVPPV